MAAGSLLGFSAGSAFPEVVPTIPANAPAFASAGSETLFHDAIARQFQWPGHPTVAISRSNSGLEGAPDVVLSITRPLPAHFSVSSSRWGWERTRALPLCYPAVRLQGGSVVGESGLIGGRGGAGPPRRVSRTDDQRDVRVFDRTRAGARVPARGRGAGRLDRRVRGVGPAAATRAGSGRADARNRPRVYRGGRRARRRRRVERRGGRFAADSHAARRDCISSPRLSRRGRRRGRLRHAAGRRRVPAHDGRGASVRRRHQHVGPGGVRGPGSPGPHRSPGARSRCSGARTRWSAYYSPFIGGVALALGLVPGVRFPVLVLAGVALACIGFFVIIILGRLEEGEAIAEFQGYPFRPESLWLPFALVGSVAAVHWIWPSLSVLLVVALLAPLLVAAVLVVRSSATGAVRIVARFAVTELPRHERRAHALSRRRRVGEEGSPAWSPPIPRWRRRSRSPPPPRHGARRHRRPSRWPVCIRWCRSPRSSRWLCRRYPIRPCSRRCASWDGGSLGREPVLRHQPGARGALRASRAGCSRAGTHSIARSWCSRRGWCSPAMTRSFGDRSACVRGAIAKATPGRPGSAHVQRRDR